MSEQRQVEHIVGNPPTNSEIYSTNLTREERKARIAAVLDRGITNDRLKVDLPEHLHGEWINRDPAEIMRMQALGFEIDTQYAPKRALHNVGDSSAVIGDVVFMTCSKEVKELIDEVAKEQFLITNGDPSIKHRRHQKGDLPSRTGGAGSASDDPNFKDESTGFDIRGSKVIDESRENQLVGNEVAEAIKAATINNKPE